MRFLEIVVVMNHVFERNLYSSLPETRRGSTRFRSIGFCRHSHPSFRTVANAPIRLNLNEAVVADGWRNSRTLSVIDAERSGYEADVFSDAAPTWAVTGRRP